MLHVDYSQSVFEAFSFDHCQYRMVMLKTAFKCQK